MLWVKALFRKGDYLTKASTSWLIFMFVFPSKWYRSCVQDSGISAEKLPNGSRQILSQSYDQNESLQILFGQESDSSASDVQKEGGWKSGAEAGEGSGKRVSTSAGGSIATALAARLSDSPHHPRRKFYIWKVLWPFINLLSPWLSGTRCKQSAPPSVFACDWLW